MAVQTVDDGLQSTSFSYTPGSDSQANTNAWTGKTAAALPNGDTDNVYTNRLKGIKTDSPARRAGWGLVETGVAGRSLTGRAKLFALALHCSAIR